MAPDQEPKPSVKIEECIHVQFYIPPLFVNGKKVKFSAMDVQGAVPPMRFLITDEITGKQVQARFHPLEMRWELVDGQG